MHSEGVKLLIKIHVKIFFLQCGMTGKKVGYFGIPLENMKAEILNQDYTI